MFLSILPILRGETKITAFYIDPVDIALNKQDMLESYYDYLLSLVSDTFSVVKLPFLDSYQH